MRDRDYAALLAEEWDADVALNWAIINGEDHTGVMLFYDM